MPSKKLILICFALLVISFGVFGYSGRWHPSETQFPTQGIDVSHHQGNIEWSLLKRQGVDFAYIKATEGGDHVDSAFVRNWSSADAAGIRRGAYHFFTFCRSGADQADNFIATVPLDHDALPPAVDLEFLGNCGNRPTAGEFRKELNIFLAKVEGHFGRRAIFYLTQEFDNEYRVSGGSDRPLWLRSLVFEPRFGGRVWTVWQASSFRKLEGIEGRVDWNVIH